MVKEEPKLKKGEKYCPKCKRVVKSKHFNNYFGICYDCE